MCRADVTLLALHHQRVLRLLAERRALGDATLRALPRDVLGEARDTVAARRALDAIPRGKPPRVRVAPAAPANTLRAAYAEAQQRFGVDWSVLAAVNFVESAFGRVRSASEAGARGPMQFLPATWREYGLGGDIDDPRDAILAAANYLHRSGASESVDRALYAYNHSTDYVRAVKRFAARMRKDERAFRTYYAWQVYVRTRERLLAPHHGAVTMRGWRRGRRCSHCRSRWSSSCARRRSSTRAGRSIPSTSGSCSPPASSTRALAVAISEAGRRRRDARLLLIGLAFLVSAGFLGLHALATPNVVVDGGSAGFVLATPIGLVLAGAFAAASAVEYGLEASLQIVHAARTLLGGRARGDARCGRSSPSPGCRRCTTRSRPTRSRRR